MKSIFLSVLTAFATVNSSVLANPGKIVNGDDATPGDYPYFVNMGTCGGALIAPDIVLSAAHCGSYKDQQLNIGAYLYQNSAEGSQPRFCSEWRSDPKYEVDGYQDYDFALCKLNEPVTIDSNIKLELNEHDAVPNDGKKLLIMGFGNLGEKIGGPLVLQDLTVSAISNDECIDKYGFGDVLTDNMLCAIGLEDDQGTCYGDSGGPLVRRKNNDDGTITDTHVGVVSFGAGCADQLPGVPEVYARTSKNIKWIKDTSCDMGSIADFCDNYPPPCDQDMTITLTTDIYAGETRWTLKDSQNNEVAKRRYLVNSYKNEHKLCVESNECYEFIIEDSYGDGMCPEGRECGSYSIDLDGNEILSDIGDFEYSRTVEICTGDPSPPNDCEDSKTFEYNGNPERTCKNWAGEGTKKEVKKKCKKDWLEYKVYDWCPKTCGKRVGLGNCTD